MSESGCPRVQDIAEYLSSPPDVLRELYLEAHIRHCGPCMGELKRQESDAGMHGDISGEVQ